MFLEYLWYKKYIVDYIDILNNILEKNYNFHIKILFIEWEILLQKKWLTDDNIYTYRENEDSIKLIDKYLEKYVNFFLFSKSRHLYLIDIIKRIWDVDKAENLLIESIKKWYI